MNNLIKMNNRYIGGDTPCYIIAEMSANHAGDFNRAIDIIHAAKESGADCIKIQTYTPDTMTIDCDNDYFQIKKGTWKNEKLYDLYNKAYTPWEWQSKLKEEAEKVGLDFLSTPFDQTSVDFLEDLEINFYKIASFELTDIPLIKYIASKGKPIIISTGMATLGEIEEAVKAIKEMKNEDICLLKCSSAYPAIPDDMNLKTIKNLKETFGVPVGLSDHSLGSVAAITAVAIGASVVEKHFCISRDIENPDSSFSMEPNEFRGMVDSIRAAERAIGKVSYKVSEKEKVSRIFRRSIFAVEDIGKGDIFDENNIRVIRPAYGLAPKYYNDIKGKKATTDIVRGTPLKWSMID
ncbi:pseudaminic acid synthase [Dethiothermospora halolimnae]|uniref:pseudaminic acid synthase n=1 Tax=Dethiothermospora halolimnae TaxID=3114390 RepID=UPI003CCBE6FF